MIDQTETSELTNSFIYSHSRELLSIIAVFMACVCILHFESLYNFVILAGAIGATVYLSWIVGYRSGVEIGVSSALESLIALGYIATEAEDDDTIVKKADDLMYFNKCRDCEDGMVYNPSATKGHENGKIKEI